MEETLFIYKIMVGELCYIGSTKDIKKRINKHKSVCYKEKSEHHNIKLYTTIREVYGTNWDNVKWNVIDCYYNVDKTFRKTIEQYYIELFDSQLNMIGAKFISRKERNKQYGIENRENILQRKKRYYNENKEKFLERQKQNYLKNREKILEKHNCICGTTYTKKHKKRHEKSQKHQNYLLTIVK